MTTTDANPSDAPSATESREGPSDGSTAGSTLQPMDPRTLAERLERGEVTLIDVREPGEHRAASIKEAALMPLSGFDPEAVKPMADKPIVVHCKAGSRSKQACRKLADAVGRTGAELYYLDGGIDAWKAAGLPVESSGGGVIDIQRQVQLVVGSMVLLFTLLGALVNPWLLIVPAFFGAGLTFAGASGTCGMAMMLAKMPWNR